MIPLAKVSSIEMYHVVNPAAACVSVQRRGFLVQKREFWDSYMAHVNSVQLYNWWEIWALELCQHAYCKVF